MSNDSSERSSQSRDGHTQSAPSTQRSTSLSVRLSPSGPSDSSPQWKVPLWVHCEQCFVTYDINPSLKLLSCGHILCAKCLHLDDANLRDSLHVPCVRCSSETYVSIGSLDSKMQGMFQQCWMDPVLQLDVSNINFMMSKQESYNKYLFKKIKEGNTLPPEWQERQNRVKATIDRIAKLKKMEQEIAKKTEAIKAEATKVHKNVCRFRSIYEKAKEEYRRKQQQGQQQRQQQGQQQRQQQGQQQNQQQRVGQQQQGQQQGQQQRQQQGQQQQGQQQQGQQQQGQQQQGQQQRQQQLPSLRSREVEQTRQTHDRNEMKTISSFPNEQSNQDIGQLKSSSSRPNLNQSAPDIRNCSQRVVPPARLNQSLDEPRGDSTRCIPGNASHRSAMPTLCPWPKSFNADNRRAPDISDFSQRVVSPARLNQSLDEPREDSPRRTPDNASHRSTMPTLRQLIDSAKKKKIRHSPLPKSLNEDNRRFEPAQRQALKRLIPSSAYDQYTNPPKRATQHAGPVDLNTSKSSIDSSK